MATPHISAEPGDFAPDVLMPGDPRRAQRIAETVLEDARLVSDVRGILGYTGTFDGRPVSVLASGMGIPSISIYATELFRFYGVERIIRIGTAGGMAPHLEVGDVVIANVAHTDSSIVGNKIPQIHFSAGATFSLTAAAADAAGVGHRKAAKPADDAPAAGRRRRRKNGSVYVGPVISSDIFYSDRPLTNELLVKHGTLAVEMEAAGLYAVAAQEGKEALAICTISDLLFRDESLSSAEREQLFDKAVALGLAAFANA
ncbi:purine-nucleoside phosphorylase [Actinotalea fermentans]|uniref:Uridine phosphorylase n=1 Tax=Actinotalea fermentans TaxID=43671 RepID=A0A511YZD2_9CELL|nr:purine-nucleoside phosphorylase [Actinotalea fermentans]KGM15618.1 purine nucleoside phosphorylase [Actinotalea fermentans ATCC 43279 = JCM 9966 = DSM 3133]GEN80560.1 purine nucleoside phosphorylase DeoD-type [Actinotalea fermentans]